MTRFFNRTGCHILFKRSNFAAKKGKMKDKFTYMTTAPIPRLVSSLAIPTIISMLVTAFYNIADTYFVGKISTQATAAVGQCMMMHVYDKLFSEYNRTVAQILLTGEDVDAPVRSEHLHNTFEALLELGVIPVVNENDSVSSAEIETGHCKVLGDNDTLSAIVARLCGADLLILLSDIDGLYDADPHKDPNARLIRRVSAVTPELRAMAGGAGTWRGTGGMATKLNAAETALAAGIEMVIANGSNMDAIYDIVAGKDVGTRFALEERR